MFSGPLRACFILLEKVSFKMLCGVPLKKKMKTLYEQSRYILEKATVSSVQILCNIMFTAYVSRCLSGKNNPETRSILIKAS